MLRVMQMARAAASSRARTRAEACCWMLCMNLLSRLFHLAGQAVAQFDLLTALTKKEKRVINKAEYMIPYHMARCPNYSWKESEEYARAEALKEKIGGIGAPSPNSVARSLALAHPVLTNTCLPLPPKLQRPRPGNAGMRPSSK